MDSRDQLLYTDCPPTRLRAVRIRRKSQQKPKQTLVTTEPTLESRIRKERESQELDENSKSTLECFSSWPWWRQRRAQLLAAARPWVVVGILGRYFRDCVEGTRAVCAACGTFSRYAGSSGFAYILASRGGGDQESARKRHPTPQKLFLTTRI